MFIRNWSGFVLALAAGVVVFALPPVMAQTFDVTPVNPKNVKSPVGGPASPGSLVYTVRNTGTTTLTITAVEVDASGTPVTPPSAWLDLGTATTGELAPDATGTITATFIAGVAAGAYEAFIKFTDSVSINDIRVVRLYVGIPIGFYESFTYPNGPLGGNGSWVGGSAGRIEVNSGRAVVLAGAGAEPATVTFPTPLTPGEDGKFVITMDTMQDVTAAWDDDPPGGSGDNFWDFYVDSSTSNFGRLYGTYYVSIRGRIGGGAVTDPFDLARDGQFHPFKMVIDTVANTTEFFYDNVSRGVLDYGTATDVIGKLYFNHWDRSSATGDHLYFDNLSVVGYDSVCSMSLTPGDSVVSTAEVGAAADPAAHAFTMTNTNSLDASYALDTVDATGAHADYGWLSLNQALGAGPTLSPEATDVVTATLDTTGLAADEYVGYLKFTNTCTPAIWYRPIKLQILGANCLLEKFPYMAGPLNGQPGWSGEASTGAIDVLSDGVLRLSGYAVGTANGPQITAVHQTAGCGCDPGELQTVSVKVRGHEGGSRYWELHFLDNAGLDLAAWRGTAGSVEAYMNGSLPASGSLTPLTGGGQFDTLEATINSNDATVNGIEPYSTRFTVISPGGARNVLGSLSHGAANAPVQSARFNRLVNNVAGDPDPVIDFDDLIVQKCAEQCRNPVFDVRDPAYPGQAVADGKVSSQDLMAFEACATGPGMAAELSFECKCMDLNNDDAIDQIDFAAFQRCYSGTAAADPDCDN